MTVPLTWEKPGRDHPSGSRGASNLHQIDNEAVMPLALEPWILGSQTASSYKAAGR